MVLLLRSHVTIHEQRFATPDPKKEGQKAMNNVINPGSHV